MKGRWYASLSVSMGMGLMAVAGLLLIAMLRVLIGPFLVAPLLAHAARPEAVLFEPASLAAAPLPERVRRRAAWRALLPEEPARREALGLPEAGPNRVVIVSDARWMDDREAGELGAYLQSGGRVLLSGWIGVRSGEDWSSGVERMRRLLGVEAVRSLTGDATLFVAAGARGPLDGDLLPGERIALAREPRVPAISGDAAELFWSTYTLRRAGSPSGAALRSRRGEGRLVWLGPTPEASAITPRTLEQMRQVVARSLDWLRGTPTGEILAWPRGASFAALVAMDSEDRFHNAIGVAAAAESADLPMTYLVLGQEAARDRAVTERIRTTGEIGSHAYRHVGFKGQPLEDQVGRLERAREGLLALGVSSPRGFRMPYESYDAATLQAAATVGFGYVLGDLEFPSMAPRLVAPGGSAPPLVQVPRVADDDYEIFDREGVTEAAQVETHLRRDLDRVAGAGGLYYLSIHTQIFEGPERLSVLSWLANAVRERGGWWARGSAIEDWWRRRAALRVGFVRTGPAHMRIDVSNLGERPIEDAALRLHAGAALARVRASGSTLFQTAPEVRFQPGRSSADLLLPEIPPGRSRSYRLEWTVASGEPGDGTPP
ncbi:MAG: polysaccharide deacetylase family protein [Myxococcota bacterium]